MITFGEDLVGTSVSGQSLSHMLATWQHARNLSVILLLENLNRAVQCRSVSVSSVIAAMQLSKDNLLSLRCDNKFMTIFDETVSLCTELDIDAPQMPCQRRPPKRFTGTTHVPNQLKCGLFPHTVL